MTIGDKAPALETNKALHLEAHDYHEAMKDPDSVIIDVRNQYESAIGHFQPPEGGAELIDPKIRNSHEFPRWLNAPETQAKLQGKKVRGLVFDLLVFRVRASDTRHLFCYRVKAFNAFNPPTRSAIYTHSFSCSRPQVVICIDAWQEETLVEANATYSQIFFRNKYSPANLQMSYFFAQEF